MIKRIVVKNGMIQNTHTLNESIEGLYDDTFEIFTLEDSLAPLYTVSANPLNPAEREFGGTLSYNIVPLSDPRFRINLSDCIDATIEIVKTYCSNLILDRYPLYKQSNISMLLGYDQTDLDVMRKYILTIREASNEVEDRLKNFTDKEEVINFNYKAFINKKVT